MREFLPEQVGEPAKTGTNRRFRYVPFLAGLVDGTLDLSEIDPIPPHEAMNALRQGRIPPKGGFLETPDGLAAFDAVPCSMLGSTVVLAPSLKSHIGENGEAHEDLVFTYQTENGLLRFLGVNFKPNEKPFLAHALGVRRYEIGPDGRTTAALPNDLMSDYEFDTSKNGFVVAKPRFHHL